MIRTLIEDNLSEAMAIHVNQTIDPVKSKIPIFIVGAGGIVRDAHLPAYRNAGFTVAGICDLRREKSEGLKRSFPEITNVYDSLQSFLQGHREEAVVYDIAVPANEILGVLEQLPQGAAVLIQKPMGETLAEARAIMNLCTRKSFAAAVNFQLRYAPFSLAAADLIVQGLIGDVYDVEIMVCVYTPWNMWDFLKEKPRVEILYHSIHYVDLVRSFLGNPEKIYASTVRHPHTPDLASTRTTMILDYNAYTQSRIVTNHGHQFGPNEQESYLKIEGTKGAIHIQMGVSLNYPTGEPDRFLFCNADTEGRWRELELLGGWFPDAFIGSMSRLQTLYRGETADKCAALRDDFTTMRLVEAAYRSGESGGVLFNDVW